MTRTLIICIMIALGSSASGFVLREGLEEMSLKADTILRGVVLDIVLLTKRVEDSGGMSLESIVDKDFTGPHAVAIFRVTEVIKPSGDARESIVLIPCGYDFDESPSELTRSKEYVIFLEKMDHHYFHPLDAYSVFRMQLGKVGTSGMDWGDDFETKKGEEAENIPYDDFVSRIRKALTTENRTPDNKAAHDER